MTRMLWTCLLLCASVRTIRSQSDSDFDDANPIWSTTAPRPTADSSQEIRTTRQVPPLPFFPSTASECTFGRGKDLSAFKCEWKMDPRRDQFGMRWQRSSGKLAYFNGGPLLDASGDSEGGYALVETSQVAPGGPTTASMSNEMMDPTEPQGRCVVFQYALQGPNVERLRLILRPASDLALYRNSSQSVQLVETNEILWEWRDETRHLWTKAAVLYSYGQSHQLSFEATIDDRVPVHRRSRGHVALDNIDLGPEDASISTACLGHCNFDGGFCGWNNDMDDHFDWNLGHGSLNGATGPARDRSNFASGQPSRGYAYIDSGFPRRPGDLARLSSPELPATGPNQPLCLRFWTHMFGNGIGSLRVGLKPSTPSSGAQGNHKVLWSLSGEAGNSWHQAQLTVASTAPFKITFEATVGRNQLGDIAIDDISLQSGPCPTGPQSAASQPGDCNFELDECGWLNAGPRESVDEIDWIRSSAESTRHQPLKDHSTATEKGYLMTLSRTAVQRPGDRAWFISRLFNGSSLEPDLRCMTFWYFMHEPIIDPAGPSLGSLRVYVRSEEDNNKSILRQIWRLQNHQSGSWLMAFAPIQQSSPYRVIIEGMWGSSRGAGSITIDDVTFYEGSCFAYPTKAKPMAAECSFDKDSCQWRNDLNNTVRPDADWRLATASRRPANLPDHTFGASSGYAYFDVFSQGGRLETIRLVGPNVTQDRRTSGNNFGRVRSCLTFWFAAFGAGDTTELNAILRDLPSSLETVLWTLRVSQLDAIRPDWNFAQVELTNPATAESTDGFAIILEGKASNGGFAVDDIAIYDGGCQTRPLAAVPINS